MSTNVDKIFIQNLSSIFLNERNEREELLRGFVRIPNRRFVQVLAIENYKSQKNINWQLYTRISQKYSNYLFFSNPFFSISQLVRVVCQTQTKHTFHPIINPSISRLSSRAWKKKYRFSLSPYFIDFFLLFPPPLLTKVPPY